MHCENPGAIDRGFSISSQRVTIPKSDPSVIVYRSYRQNTENTGAIDESQMDRLEYMSYRQNTENTGAIDESLFQIVIYL